MMRLMRIITGGLVLIFLFPYNSLSQNVFKLWDNTIQGDRDDGSFFQIKKVTNDRILISGFTNSDSGYDKSAANPNHEIASWLILSDSNGSIIWDRDFKGSTGQDHAIVSINDNSHVLLTRARFYGDATAPITPGSSAYGSWLCAFDTTGVIQWNKRFHGGIDSLNSNYTILPYAATVVNNSVYVIATAQTYPAYIGGDLTDLNCSSYSNDNKDLLFYKVDPNNMLSNEWHHIYGGDSVDWGSSLLALANGDFLLGGVTSSNSGCNQTVSTYNSPFYDYFLIRVDSTGGIIWQKKYGGDKKDWLGGIIDSGNNEFLLYGHTTSDSSFDISANGSNDTSLWLVKIDGLGNKIWDKRFGSCEGFTIWTPFINEYFTETLDAIYTSDGGYLLVSNVRNSLPCGDVTEPGRGREDYWLLKLDSFGNKQWDKRLGGPGRDIAQRVIEMTPGYYIVGGLTRSDNAQDTSALAPGGDKSEYTIGVYDIWLAGVVDSSIVQGINNISYEPLQFNCYPNPAQENLTIQVIAKNHFKGTIYITDIAGKKLLQVPMNSPTQKLNISSLTSGIYFVVLSDDKSQAVRKLVKN